MVRTVRRMEFDETFGYAAHTELTVTFTDMGGKTRIDIHQEGCPTASMRDAHAQVWPAFLHQLEHYLSAI